MLLLDILQPRQLEPCYFLRSLNLLIIASYTTATTYVSLFGAEDLRIWLLAVTIHFSCSLTIRLFVAGQQCDGSRRPFVCPPARCNRMQMNECKTHSECILTQYKCKRKLAHKHTTTTDFEMQATGANQNNNNNNKCALGLCTAVILQILW